MPGHFTHIYTARRVADLLFSGEFDDWPQELAGVSSAFPYYKPQFCGEVMREWEKFTAIGAIGPDLFYFSQDYNTNPVGAQSDELMLALATYYFYDKAKEEDWEPLLIILDKVNSTIAALLRFLIKLQKIWDEFLAAWNATIGPLVHAATSLLDDLQQRVFDQLPDDTVVYPGHGRDTNLGIERPPRFLDDARNNRAQPFHIIGMQVDVINRGRKNGIVQRLEPRLHIPHDFENDIPGGRGSGSGRPVH